MLISIYGALKPLLRAVLVHRKALLFQYGRGGACVCSSLTAKDMRDLSRSRFSNSSITTGLGEIMKNQHIITLITATLLLTACAAPNDPSLAEGIQRKGDGVYSVTQFGPFGSDMTTQAVRQCELDGQGKKLNIITSTTYNGVTGTNYPMLLFRCGK